MAPGAGRAPRAIALASVVVAGALAAHAQPAARGPARARPPAPPTSGPGRRPLTLAAALSAARTAPAQRAAALKTRAASDQVAAAGAWPATTLSVSSSHTTAHLGLAASLPLPVFGRLGADRQVARADLDLARARQRQTDVTAVRDVTRAWLELARVEARAQRSARSAGREQELAQVARTRESAGDASHAEVVAAAASASRARAQAASDATAIDAASASLAALLGWDPAVPLHAQGGIPAPREVPPLAQLRGRRALHPDARVADAEAGTAGAQVVVARRARWPRLSVDLESLFDDPTLPGNDYRAGITLELPLLGHGGAAQRAAEARRRAALAGREAALATIDGQIVAAYRRYQAARRRARTLAGEVLPAEREAADLARAAYREGQGGLVAVIEADRALAQADGELIDAEADAASALAELVWAAGGSL